MVSCDKDRDVIDRLDYIQDVGDNDPQLAMRMLDSLTSKEINPSEHVRMRCDLLAIRLNDKADVLPHSDLRIKNVVGYFNKHGDNKEKQSAYYYAGSVYRDLKDYPRALINFRTAASLCKQGETFDSLMLRNTYSNLSWVYYQVQDYAKSAAMSSEEAKMEQKLGILEASTLVGLGAAQLRCNQNEKAKRSFVESLRLLKKEKQADRECYFDLLYSFSDLAMAKEADSCFAAIQKMRLGRQNLYFSEWVALGWYYAKIKEEQDSAVACYKAALDKAVTLENRYDASKLLFRYYHDHHDVNKADYYANLFVKNSAALDLGKRQELASTANNYYEYHYDANQEKIITEKDMQIRKRSFWTILSLVIIAAAFITLYFRRKYIHEKEKGNLMNQLDTYKGDNKQLQQEIDQQKESTKQKEEELEKSEKQMRELTAKLDESRKEIEKNKQLLQEKITQANELVGYIGRIEMTTKVGDAIKTVYQAANGKANMSEEVWRKLIKEVNDVDPDFKKELTGKMKHFSPEEMHVCYLIYIGMSKPQIEAVTGMATTTVWRCVKKHAWIVERNKKMHISGLKQQA